MANGTSALRLSGMNSGMDTEAIVNALTATTKNKINTNQRKVLKLQAQQTAYRSLIDSFNNFKTKYFDILNSTTSLKSNTLFNSFKSNLYNAAGTPVNGVTVYSGINATPGNYKVKVEQVATQATIKSASADGKAVDIGSCNDSNQTYSMVVTVGSKKENITFQGGTEEQVRQQINNKLSVFGTRGDGSNMVTIGADNKLSSADRTAVVFNSPSKYQSSYNLGSVDVNNMQTGNNTFTITVGNTTKTVTFSTVSADYFDEIFDEHGNIKPDADKDKVKLFKEIASDQRQKKLYDEFKASEGNWSEEQKKNIANNWAQKLYDDEVNAANNKYNEAVKGNLAVQSWSAVKDNINDNGSVDGTGLSNDENRIIMAKVSEYQGKVTSGEIDPDSVSLKSYVEQEYKNDIKATFTTQDIEDYGNSDAGKSLKDLRDKEIEKAEANAKARTDTVVKKEQNAVYQTKFEEAKRAAFDAGKADGSIGADVEFEKFNYTKAQFEATTQYTEYQTEAENIANNYAGRHDLLDYDSISESAKVEWYGKYESTNVPSEEDFLANYTAADAVRDFNTANIENNLGALSFKDEAVNISATVDSSGNITIEAKGKYTGTPQNFSITQAAGNATDFGLQTTDSSGSASQVDITSKLSQLGLTPDSDGNYGFSINGVDFKFSGDTTVAEMMRKVNASNAGVTMTYTTLTNQFTITAKEYGTDTTISIGDGAGNLLSALGFNVSNPDFTAGTNSLLTINGVQVETQSNSYTVDDTTFTFTQAAVGSEFTNEVTRDYSKPINAIKSFVEDYNKLIDEVYGYVDDEPNKDYYFLTDDDKEEMDLSDSQEEKWEKLANKGILYRDTTLTNIMTKLRTAVYSTVEAADGKTIGLATLGIKTSSNWRLHGKLEFDSNMSDEQFEEIFAKYADDFAKLFTDPENGISKKFTDVIDSATKTTGDVGERGTLVEKAGVAGTSSATENSIGREIDRLKNTITNLKKRYDQQQERFWKIYSNMETMLGGLNSQSSYINQLMGM